MLNLSTSSSELGAGAERSRAETFARAMLIRGVESRLLDLFAQGKLFGTVHTCIGQEFSGVAVGGALGPDDLIFSNHRCHGHFLARTDDVDGLIAEIMGRQSGVCGGRGGSQHLCAQGFYSNGIQGGIVPVAAGLAFALKQKQSSGIAVVFIGDGTLGEGVLYETLNLASKWDLPLLIVLENNLYAQSTSQVQTLAGDICSRAAAFDIGTSRGETWNPAELIETAADCVRRVREGRRPHFLRVDTHRLMAHSKGDDPRDKRELESYWAVDAISRFVRDHADQAGEIQRAITERIDAAVGHAESAPFAVLEPQDEDQLAPFACSWRPAPAASTERIVALLHASLQRNLQRDERIVLFGEDIEGPYGGAFKVTRNLSQEFPGRVRNTPISEAAIVGLGNGLALQGMIPVVEIMFGDFLLLAADQIINHAAKFRYMYNGQVSVPLIVRTPMGGKRGYGPTHSQSLEKHFLGLPGTRVLALHSRQDPGVIYDRLFQTIDRPTIVIENKLLYGTRLSEPVPEGFVIEHSDEPFPTTRIRPQAEPDLTLLCYGGMLPDAERAANILFEEHERVVEIICPTQLYPFNLWPLLQSVEKSGRLLIVEEGLNFAAFGAEVVTQLCELKPGALRRVQRLSSRRHPIPSSGPLEKEALPGPASITTAALELVNS